MHQTVHVYHKNHLQSMLLAKRPRTTMSNYRQPRRYKRKEDLNRYLNLLRKAGMPE